MMRKGICLGLASVGAAAFLSGTATPASAATSGDTTVTFALVGAELSIDVQPTADLGTGATGAASVSGQLGTVEVSDLRGGIQNWSASATSTTFSNGGTGAGRTVSSGVSYTTGALTTSGTIVIAPIGPTALSGTPATVARPTAVVGNNTAAWNPTLTVSLPSDALAGSYSGTITTSVL